MKAFGNIKEFEKMLMATSGNAYNESLVSSSEVGDQVIFKPREDYYKTLFCPNIPGIIPNVDDSNSNGKDKKYVTPPVITTDASKSKIKTDTALLSTIVNDNGLYQKLSTKMVSKETSTERTDKGSTIR